MEFVYVVPRFELFELAAPHGFLAAEAEPGEMARLQRRIRERGFFVERRRAEEDASLKQIIPYTLVARGDELLLLRRTKKGGDARLHDKLSIGAGGHVNPPDAEGGADPVAACAHRELDEELELEGKGDLRVVGAINDDSNAVGAVHFGLVHVLRLDPHGNARVREGELLQASFVPRPRILELAQDRSTNLESWSRLIALELDAALPPS